MKIPFFDYKRQLKIIKPKIINSIATTLDSGKLILGGEVEKFEKNFSIFCGVKFGVGVNSGTDAIKIGLRALGIKEGDEIITVANTAVPTVSAIREIGAIPKFIDIKEDYTMNELLIERILTKKTKAIIPVHLYGQPCNMPAISKIAKKNKLLIIEDCAQAHGAMINGKKVGSFGELSCFSFYPTKNLGAYGDGGMIVTSDARLAEKCRMLRMYGMKKGYFAEIEGFNSRLDEMQAAILNIKLKYLDEWNTKRKMIAQSYLNGINNRKILTPEISSVIDHAFHLFVIRTEKRDDLIKYLNKSGIGYGIHYPVPLHLQPAYKFLKVKKRILPLTEKFAKQIVSLPIFPELKKEEIKKIISTVNKF
jgi:dTDP-4-amino-4,6-dideoxygalactose transaminase